MGEDGARRGDELPASVVALPPAHAAASIAAPEASQVRRVIDGVLVTS